MQAGFAENQSRQKDLFKKSGEEHAHSTSTCMQVNSSAHQIHKV
jgi:hypothetical protein